MRRRDFITVLAGATAWISVARAQEPRREIGVLSSSAYGAAPGSEADFIQGLKDTGFLEGKDISIQWRWAEGQYNRLRSFASELVGRGVAVIVAWDAPSSFAAKAATKTIPIAFLTGADPVKTGLVNSFSRPGGNLTGVSLLVSLLGPKRLEVLLELVPTARMISLLVNPENPNIRADIPEIQQAARALGRHLEVLTASTENELNTAFTDTKADALLVMPDPYLNFRRHQLIALTARHAIPPYIHSESASP
jgi:putative tryptophan/tyrosine transport system substrate-binding protein